MMNLASLQTVLVWQIAVMFAYVCLFNDSIEDRSIKYAEEFSMQC